MNITEEPRFATGLAHLRKRYPGRCLIVGVGADGHPVIVYAIMGRGEGSRDRYFHEPARDQRLDPNGELDQETIETAVSSGKELSPEEAALIIYPALGARKFYEGPAPRRKALVATNGEQTEPLLEMVREGDFEAVLSGYSFEPDPPRTPRISAIITTPVPGPEQEGGVRIRMSIIRPDPKDEDTPLRITYGDLPVEPGLGYLLTTYQGDQEELLPFDSPPLWVPLLGGINAQPLAQYYWDMLDPDNRVALVARIFTPDGAILSTKIINKYPPKSK